MTVGKPVVYQHAKSMDWVGSLVGMPFVTQALLTVTSTVPMGGNGQINSKTCAYPNSIAPMGTKQTCWIIPDLQFWVLVVGRANTGKTLILQWVCDTTESHKIYWGGEEVCGPNFCPQVWSHSSANPDCYGALQGRYLMLWGTTRCYRALWLSPEFADAVDQVKLNLSMDVCDSTSLNIHFHLNMVSVRQAQHQWWTCVLQSHGLSCTVQRVCQVLVCERSGAWRELKVPRVSKLVQWVQRFRGGHRRPTATEAERDQWIQGSLREYKRKLD